MSKHTCPAPGCSVQVPASQLMCRPHWFRVPLALRVEVWNTWRAMQWDRGKTLEQSDQAWRAHNLAITAATEYVRQKLEQQAPLL